MLNRIISEDKKRKKILYIKFIVSIYYTKIKFKDYIINKISILIIYIDKSI